MIPFLDQRIYRKGDVPRERREAKEQSTVLGKWALETGSLKKIVDEKTGVKNA